MATEVYYDSGNVILVTNEKDKIRTLQEIFPRYFEKADSLDLAPESSEATKSEEFSPFANGKYYGMRPSEYVDKYGVDGALKLFRERDIPEDMRNEITRVCATAIKNDIENRRMRKVNKQEFLMFVHRYDAMIGKSVRKQLSVLGFDTVENYCKEESNETIQRDYEALCEKIHKRATTALS